MDSIPSRDSKEKRILEAGTGALKHAKAESYGRKSEELPMIGPPAEPMEGRGRFN